MTLRKSGIKVAAASRTESPDLAKQMARLLTFPPDALGARQQDGVMPERLWDYFDHTEIYPGSKIGHFKNIRKKMDVGFEDMVFFDDEARNAEVERELGVVTVIVSERTGVTAEGINQAVRRWRNQKSGKKEMGGSSKESPKKGGKGKR